MVGDQQGEQIARAAGRAAIQLVRLNLTCDGDETAEGDHGVQDEVDPPELLEALLCDNIDHHATDALDRLVAGDRYKPCGLGLLNRLTHGGQVAAKVELE